VEGPKNPEGLKLDPSDAYKNARVFFCLIFILKNGIFKIQKAKLIT
jgi:hypothetical protein